MSVGGKHWLEHFTTDEIQELRVVRDHRAWLTVLMHESAHYTLFKNRSLNDFVGNWLAGSSGSSSRRIAFSTTWNTIC